MAKQYFQVVITRGLDETSGKLEQDHLEKLNNYLKYDMVRTNAEIAKMAQMPMPLPYEREVEEMNTTVFVHKFQITYTTFLCCEDEEEEERGE